MEINELVSAAFSNALVKGFWDNTAVVFAMDYMEKDVINQKLARLMLVTTEVAEAAQAIRKVGGTDEELAEELADIVIRVADFCGAYRIDLALAIEHKMEVNRARPAMHGRLV